jgi:hypothetical protein
MQAILGSDRLVSLYGKWPSFHDAEVLRVTLDRAGHPVATGPTLTVELYAFEVSSRLADDGTYARAKEAVVTLAFRGVALLDLAGFNEQNALFSVTIDDLRERGLERVAFDVAFSASYGMAATFQCAEIEVTGVRPLAT